MTGPGTYEDILSTGRKTLEEAQVPDAGLDAWLLFSHVFGMSRSEYYAHGRETPENAEYLSDKERAYYELIERRSRRIPLQHLTGYQEFMGYPLSVSGDVLIPRKETEILTETAAGLIKEMIRGKRPEEKVRVLDLCTGSGCIAISLKKMIPQISCDASDVSEKALAAAEKNAEALEAPVRFILSDIWEKIGDVYDVIVSNPPYIPTDLIGSLEEEVRAHDPVTALDGGADGLVFYRRIIDGIDARLKNGGHVLFEIGHDQAAQVSRMLRENGFSDIRVIKDYAGNDRIVSAVFTDEKDR